MHIPDGLLSLPVALATYAITVAVVAYSLRKLRDFPEERIPLLGLFGAGVFAAQMVNFPIVGGVSGHLLGAVLLTVLVGPYAAVVIMSAVLLVQTLLFGDGGVMAIGANVLNMGILGAFLGHRVYAGLKRINEGLAIGAASWLAVVLGAALASVEIGLSHNVPFTKLLTLMVGYHALIGIGEAVITLFVVNALRTRLPEVGGVPA